MSQRRARAADAVVGARVLPRQPESDGELPGRLATAAGPAARGICARSTASPAPSTTSATSAGGPARRCSRLRDRPAAGLDRAASRSRRCSRGWCRPCASTTSRSSRSSRWSPRTGSTRCSPSIRPGPICGTTARCPPTRSAGSCWRSSAPHRATGSRCPMTSAPRCSCSSTARTSPRTGGGADLSAAGGPRQVHGVAETDLDARRDAPRRCARSWRYEVDRARALLASGPPLVRSLRGAGRRGGRRLSSPVGWPRSMRCAGPTSTSSTRRAPSPRRRDIARHAAAPVGRPVMTADRRRGLLDLRDDDPHAGPQLPLRHPAAAEGQAARRCARSTRWPAGPTTSATVTCPMRSSASSSAELRQRDRRAGGLHRSGARRRARRRAPDADPDRGVRRADRRGRDGPRRRDGSRPSTTSSATAGVWRDRSAGCASASSAPRDLDARAWLCRRARHRAAADQHPARHPRGPAHRPGLPADR